jgi:hypothetical protein
MPVSRRKLGGLDSTRETARRRRRMGSPPRAKRCNPAARRAPRRAQRLPADPRCARRPAALGALGHGHRPAHRRDRHLDRVPGVDDLRRLHALAVDVYPPAEDGPDAALRVLKKRAAHSHLSIRTWSTTTMTAADDSRAPTAQLLRGRRRAIRPRSRSGSSRCRHRIYAGGVARGTDAHGGPTPSTLTGASPTSVRSPPWLIRGTLRQKQKVPKPLAKAKRDRRQGGAAQGNPGD